MTIPMQQRMIGRASPGYDSRSNNQTGINSRVQTVKQFNNQQNEMPHTQQSMNYTMTVPGSGTVL